MCGVYMQIKVTEAKQNACFLTHLIAWYRNQLDHPDSPYNPNHPNHPSNPQNSVNNDKVDHKHNRDINPNNPNNPDNSNNPKKDNSSKMNIISEGSETHGGIGENMEDIGREDVGFTVKLSSVLQSKPLNNR